MSDKQNELAKRLEEARADFAENGAEIVKLNEGKENASKNGRDAFAAWRDEFDWRAVEHDRLTTLIATLESEHALEASAAADARQRELYTAQNAVNIALAERIKTELQEINTKALALLNDAVSAAIEDGKINAALPSGLTPLVSAHTLARNRSGRGREDIGSKQVRLWARADNGALIGDQELVEDVGNDAGIVKNSSRSHPPIKCRKMLFEMIRFYPAEGSERLVPLWQMRLLDAEGPRVLFDGTNLDHLSEVIVALNRVERRSEPRERPIETEIRPLAATAHELERIAS